MEKYDKVTRWYAGCIKMDSNEG